MNILSEIEVNDLLSNSSLPDSDELEEILAKAGRKEGLSLADAAQLLQITSENDRDKLFRAAKKVKDDIYGNRIVLFAPLYISDYCVNNCAYCGFHVDNQAPRTKLSLDQVADQVRILEDMGHKRLLLEFGEDPHNNTIDYITDVIKTIYCTKSGKGEIRRVNVNIAATTVENYKKLKDCDIGTYQLFQETYHRPTYERIHQGPKADYNRQITAHERAFEAGIDDYGMGVLFGLYDLKFEVISLLSHIKYLEGKIGVGPHTISVPRYNSAATVDYDPKHHVSDEDFLKMIAILRLAVPYAGMIISTRETPEIRRQAFQIGISQTSAASRTSPGGYGEGKENLEQFDVHDQRTVDEVVADIYQLGYLPSYCTACYRNERTGLRFMELAKSGKIHELCQPNALQTFLEYLIDYATPETRMKGEEFINKEIEKIEDPAMRQMIYKNLERVRSGERDVFI